MCCKVCAGLADVHSTAGFGWMLAGAWIPELNPTPSCSLTILLDAIRCNHYWQCLGPRLRRCSWAVLARLLHRNLLCLFECERQTCQGFGGSWRTTDHSIWMNMMNCGFEASDDLVLRTFLMSARSTWLHRVVRMEEMCLLLLCNIVGWPRRWCRQAWAASHTRVDSM